MSSGLRIGYIGGQAGRVNERAIDSQWVGALGEYAELVPIPPLKLMKWAGGDPSRDPAGFLAKAEAKGEALAAICAQYGVSTLYANLPPLIPYLLLARNSADVPLNLFFLAHSVGSEWWMKQWLAIAPLLRAGDTLLCATDTAKEALLSLSPAYSEAFRAPLCIRTEPAKPLRTEANRVKQLLCMGRLEDVKNVHVLLDVFHAVKEAYPDVHLSIAGEYTGRTPEQIAAYRSLLEEKVEAYGLQMSVTFTGPVSGEAKDALFRSADVLLNFSTDPGETFGYNLIEAKAWGLPVLCTAWDGFRELVEDGRDAVLVGVGWSGPCPQIDPAEAAAKLLGLLRDEQRLAAMRAEALAGLGRYAPAQVMPQLAARLAERESLLRGSVLPAAARGTVAPGHAAVPTAAGLADGSSAGLGPAGVPAGGPASDAGPSGQASDGPVSQAGEGPADTTDTAVFQRPLAGSPALYTPAVRSGVFASHTPLSLLAMPGDTPYEAWMPLCRPFIAHFAAPAAGAELTTGKV
ncbi:MULTISPECIES: glycosyltransferase family 4 protein [Paenibacillus]|uniref:glycosyltransferase family 4 protein n=1 Tax=Paenibacillus TaxID=44249 RepID=UPI0022B8AE6B|nr:glycosyltransferase [Paenibacillus caseinilyticus]MCZ8519915.1 glycosyltransferase [Paenibacillus caseinilyticus]